MASCSNVTDAKKVLEMEFKELAEKVYTFSINACKLSSEKLLSSTQDYQEKIDDFRKKAINRKVFGNETTELYRNRILNLIRKLDAISLDPQAMAPIAATPCENPTSATSEALHEKTTTNINTHNFDQNIPAQASLKFREPTENFQPISGLVFESAQNNALSDKKRNDKYKIGTLDIASVNLDGLEENIFGIKEIEKDERDGKHTYYFCGDVFIGEKTPNDSAVNDRIECNKKLTSKNHNFVYLSPNTPWTEEEFQKSRFHVKRRNKKFAEIANNLKATSLNYILDKEGNNCALNVREELFDRVDRHLASLDAASHSEQNKHLLNISSFKLITQDLDYLHEEKMHHLDIKIENLGINDGNVWLFDTDSMLIQPKSDELSSDDVVKEINALPRVAYTAVFFPECLLFNCKEKYQKDKPPSEKVSKVRSIVDTFQLLLCMMTGTSGNLFLGAPYDENSKTYINKREMGLRNYKTAVEFPNQVFIRESCSEMEFAEKWVQKYVKPEFTGNVLDLLYAPWDFWKNQDLFRLQDVINWDVCSEQ
ncbi:MAG: hypothetical protein GY908_05000 [Flavobacteriales bacterium]|nr:hypothetical protein [Flavobacteriales bacterium]